MVIVFLLTSDILSSGGPFCPCASMMVLELMSEQPLLLHRLFSSNHCRSRCLWTPTNSVMRSALTVR